MCEDTTNDTCIEMKILLIKTQYIIVLTSILILDKSVFLIKILSLFKTGNDDFSFSSLCVHILIYSNTLNNTNVQGLQLFFWLTFWLKNGHIFH